MQQEKLCKYVRCLSKLASLIVDGLWRQHFWRNSRGKLWVTVSALTQDAAHRKFMAAFNDSSIYRTNLYRANLNLNFWRFRAMVSSPSQFALWQSSQFHQSHVHCHWKFTNSINSLLEGALHCWSSFYTTVIIYGVFRVRTHSDR
jgi:hypothetical protein